jgi:hypothetical protein
MDENDLLHSTPQLHPAQATVPVVLSEGENSKKSKSAGGYKLFASNS